MNQDVTKAKALEIAIQHISALSNNDAKAVRDLLADDVHFMVMTSVPRPDLPNPLEGHTAEEFIKVITSGDARLLPGSLQALKSVGDDHQALLLVCVKGAVGPQSVTLLAARHYVVDKNDKITNELVILSPYDGEI